MSLFGDTVGNGCMGVGDGGEGKEESAVMCGRGGAGAVSGRLVREIVEGSLESSESFIRKTYHTVVHSFLISFSIRFPG